MTTMAIKHSLIYYKTIPAPKRKTHPKRINMERFSTAHPYTFMAISLLISPFLVLLGVCLMTIAVTLPIALLMGWL